MTQAANQGLPSDGGLAPQTNVVAEPVPGSAEYDAMILERAGDTQLRIDGQQVTIETKPAEPAKTEEAPKPARPDYIPEKFWDGNLENSTKKLAQSYTELQKSKQVRADDGKYAPKTPVTPAADPAAKVAVDIAQKAYDVAVSKAAAEPANADLAAAAKTAHDALVAANAKSAPQAPAEDQARQAVQNVGLDFDALASEFQANGKLADATYQNLEAKGLTRGIVDSYIAGQQAIAAQITTSAHQLAGGTAESYKAMADWAKANIPAAELTDYNAQVNGTLSAVQSAVKGMYARYQSAVGFNPTQMEMGNAGPTGLSAGTYASLQEMTQDMKDPRYARDPAYRAKIEAKANRSTF
jgi:hypothetical protein